MSNKFKIEYTSILVISNIELGFYDDRIEIVNFGGISYDQTMEELLKNPKSSRRNQLICDVFSRLNYMERRGSGIEKIMEAYRNDKLKPKFEGNQHTFTLTFYSRLYQNVPVNVLVKLNKTEKSILKLIEEKNEITHKEIAEILEITEKTARRNTQNLREKGLLERIGSDKTGYWKIIK